jgi:glyoxylase-like metal-dependent hydrolase (beta-lactamase superfamily II)
MKTHFIDSSRFPMQLTSNLFMLGNYFFNLFLIKGSCASAIFETGISAVTDSVIKQLGQLNIEPDYLICSHPHSDHITGLPGLIEQYPKAQVIAAKEAPAFLQHPKAGPALVKEDAFMSKSLANFGIRPGRPPLESVPDLSCAKLIGPKYTLDLGGIRLDLKTVGGHSPGNLMGMLPEQKTLLVSDSLGFHFPGRGFLPLFFTGAADYLTTLKEIRDFSASIICPAHQGPVQGQDAVRAVKESVDTTIRLIRKIQTSEEPEEMLADGIFKANYVDEFTLYTKENIKNCSGLLVKRARQAGEK